MEDAMPNALVYRGTIKHKLWKPDGGYGTICPDWTHEANGRGFGGDPYKHPWPATSAWDLLQSSYLIDGKRYAAANGIAFCAHPTRDGTWHGFPLPWSDVPDAATDWLIENGHASKRDKKRQRLSPQPGIYWALTTDD